MMGIRTAWREDSIFSPAENVFGSQLVLLGQFLSAPELPSPSFLSDFQGLLAGRAPLPTIHNTLPSVPDSLPEDLLLSRFVLVRQDAVQPPLSPLYTGPFLVLERSLHFFKLQIGDRVDTVSSHRLKACILQMTLPPPYRQNAAARQRPRSQLQKISPPAAGASLLPGRLHQQSQQTLQKQLRQLHQSRFSCLVFAFVPPFRPPCPHRQAASPVRLIADRKVSKIQQTEL
jgi:hypothetical protein